MFSQPEATYVLSSFYLESFLEQNETKWRILVQVSNIFQTSESEQDKESQVAPQVEKYHHTIPNYPLNNILQVLIV